jgi:hypothetical protein
MHNATSTPIVIVTTNQNQSLLAFETNIVFAVANRNDRLRIDSVHCSFSWKLTRLQCKAHACTIHHLGSFGLGNFNVNDNAWGVDDCQLNYIPDETIPEAETP